MDHHISSDWQPALKVTLHETGKRYIVRGSTNTDPEILEAMGAAVCDRIEVRREAPTVILVRHVDNDTVTEVLHSGTFSVEYAPTSARLDFSVDDILAGDDVRPEWARSIILPERAFRRGYHHGFEAGVQAMCDGRPVPEELGSFIDVEIAGWRAMRDDEAAKAEPPRWSPRRS